MYACDRFIGTGVTASNRTSDQRHPPWGGGQVQPFPPLRGTDEAKRLKICWVNTCITWINIIYLDVPLVLCLLPLTAARQHVCKSIRYVRRKRPTLTLKVWLHHHAVFRRSVRKERGRMWTPRPPDGSTLEKSVKGCYRRREIRTSE